MNYIRQSSVREVVEHFLKSEMGRPIFVERIREFTHWLLLPDDAFFAQMKKLNSEREAANERNPLFLWTTGSEASRVKRWVVADAFVEELYSCAISPSMRSDLSVVRGNLLQFSKIANKYPEFELDSVPDGEVSFAVGIHHSNVGRDGDIEVIDGFHRIVSMAHHGVKIITVFLGQIT